jgi:hypothetical protein
MATNISSIPFAIIHIVSKTCQNKVLHLPTVLFEIVGFFVMANISLKGCLQIYHQFHLQYKVSKTCQNEVLHWPISLLIVFCGMSHETYQL